MKPVEQLIEFESMLHASVQRVGRAVKNLRQEMGGFSSTTPGNGSPGGGKGGGPTVAIERPSWELGRLPQDPEVLADWLQRRDRADEPKVDQVPITRPESIALGFTGPDRAADALAELEQQANFAALGAMTAVERMGRTCPGRHGQPIGADRLVVLAYGRLRGVVRLNPTNDQLAHTEALAGLVDPVPRVFDLVQRWGYTAAEPAVAKTRVGLLAVDLTEMWCTSHLRVGVKRDRSRGELCDWCYRHGPLLVATWAAPPVEVVRLHVEHGKVYAHQFEPHIRAERDRQRTRAKARRR
jgi:hypothetical protein